MNLKKRNQALAGLMSLCFCLLGCDNSDSGNGTYGDDGAGTGNGGTGDDDASAEEDSADDEDDEGDDGGATPADTGEGSGGTTTGETGDETEGQTDDGTEDEGSSDGEESLSFETDVAPIIAANCSCHRSASPPAGLDLNDGSGFASLVSVASTADVLYVSPGDASGSYIVNKLQGMQASVGGSGSQMPLGGMLQDSEIDTIIAWIDGGAAE